MKKMFFIIMLIVIVSGVLVLGAFLWTNKTNKRINISTGSIHELKTETLKISDVKTIDLRLRSAIVKIENGTKNEIYLKDVAKNQFIVNNDNKILKVYEDDAQRHQIEIGKTPTIVLTVSNPYLKDVIINQLNGTLKLKNLSIETLSIKHSNGGTFLRNLTINDSSQLIKKNGSTTLSKVKVPGITVSVDNGQFKLNGEKKATSGGKYHQGGLSGLVIHSGSGQVILNE
ncbi:DUF4097 family beta strand repeat-containing protein [Companilactobacillus sp. HBUAS56257]|uniref:DUF4097 family beta strand repeat-containing protein n=1 Tax=Companilactobacillus sp. HBUAS56257 TaxID=3109360 RepID=UPI002FF2AEA5